ncbi:MAG: hypothetical protein ACP5E5_13125 [Acidobacteriaceae bacterium]
MKRALILNAIAFWVFALSAGVAVGQRSKTLVVESPDNLRALVVPNPSAMYLYSSNDGSTLLYVESKNGRELSILDVTDPSEVERLAPVALPAPTTYDFVRYVGHHEVLIRYRNGAGVALLNLAHYKHPTLMPAKPFENAVVLGQLGATGLLMAQTKAKDASKAPLTPHNYEVVDTLHPHQPKLLATIDGVRQILARGETGTLFLLNQDGVTMVRRLRVEAQYQETLDEMNGN